MYSVWFQIVFPDYVEIDVLSFFIGFNAIYSDKLIGLLKVFENVKFLLGNILGGEMKTFTLILLSLILTVVKMEEATAADTVCASTLGEALQATAIPAENPTTYTLTNQAPMQLDVILYDANNKRIDVKVNGTGLPFTWNYREGRFIPSNAKRVAIYSYGQNVLCQNIDQNNISITYRRATVLAVTGASNQTTCLKSFEEAIKAPTVSATNVSGARRLRNSTDSQVNVLVYDINNQRISPIFHKSDMGLKDNSLSNSSQWDDKHVASMPSNATNVAIYSNLYGSICTKLSQDNQSFYIKTQQVNLFSLQ